MTARADAGGGVPSATGLAPGAPPPPGLSAGLSRSVLEEEREFLLRSLRDLEAERQAGDIDDIDFEALKDDYTVRAAAVLRQLAGTPDGPGLPSPERAATRPARRSRQLLEAGTPALPYRRRRWAMGLVAALVAGSIAGYAVNASSGTRLPGQVVSGTAVGAEKVAQLLARAQRAAARGDAVSALKDCRAILAEDPNQPQALAEEGWLLAQTQQPALQAQGLGDLTQAAGLASGDATIHLYRGIVLLDVGRNADAVGDLQWYLAHNPDPLVKPRVQEALSKAQAGLASPDAPVPPLLP